MLHFRGGSRLNPCTYRRITTDVFSSEVIDLGQKLGVIYVTENTWQVSYDIKLFIFVENSIKIVSTTVIGNNFKYLTNPLQLIQITSITKATEKIEL